MIMLAFKAIIPATKSQIGSIRAPEKFEIIEDSNGPHITTIELCFIHITIKGYQ